MKDNKPVIPSHLFRLAGYFLLIFSFSQSVVARGLVSTEQVVPPTDYSKQTDTKLQGDQRLHIDCSKAANNFLDQLSTNGESDPMKVSSWGTTKLVTASCLTHIDSTGPRNKLAKTIEDLVGGLTLRDNSLCTAVRISMSEIVTARHCFYPRTGGDILVDLTQLRFVLSGDTGHTHMVAGVPCSDNFSNTCSLPEKLNQPFTEKDDWIVLRVDGFGTAPPKINLATNVAKGDRVMVVGTSVIFSGKNKSAFVPDFFKTAENVGCVIGAIQDGCIYHGCTTAAGFSGAPIFRYNKNAPNEIDLIGIQIEGVGERGGSCSALPTNGQGNVAIAPAINLAN